MERRLRPSTQREYRRILNGSDTRAWRDRPSSVGKRDVLDVIVAMDGRGSPGASKRALVYLRKFFNWCAERDIISVVPTDRIRPPPPHPEVKRDRVLSDEELRYLLCALETERSVFGPLLRLTEPRHWRLACSPRSDASASHAGATRVRLAVASHRVRPPFLPPAG